MYLSVTTQNFSFNFALNMIPNSANHGAAVVCPSR